MTKEIEKTYSELSKKFKLPVYKELDFEFEISNLEEKNFLLRAVIRRMSERLEFYSTLLEEQIQPDGSNIYAMHEARNFDEDEKKRMFELYGRLMNLGRLSIEVSLNHDEKEEADFVGVFFDQWKVVKEELMPIVKKMRASWKAIVAKDDVLEYFG